MSYKMSFPEDGDDLSGLISIMNDCIVSCKKMLLSDTDDEFVRWFDKSKRIDPRTTYFFLKKHWDDIPYGRKIFCKSFINKIDGSRKLSARAKRRNLS